MWQQLPGVKYLRPWSRELEQRQVPRRNPNVASLESRDEKPDSEVLQ